MRTFLLAGACAALLATPVTAQTTDGAPASPGATGKGANTGAASANPLLADWKGPYGGVPPFDQVRIADFLPAADAAIAAQQAEIDAITANPAPPTFDNTILALERAGKLSDRVDTVAGIWHANLNGPEFRKISIPLGAKGIAASNRINQDSKLFARVDAVYQARAKLNPVQQRLTWVYWNRLIRAGARLDPAQKKQLSAYNLELAALYNKFSVNELSDEETYTLVLDSQDQLAGLPQSQIDSAAAEATRRGMAGKWVIANTRSSMEPFLTYSARRDLRERGYAMWAARGDNGGEHDNNAVVQRILKVRAAKAKLLGYPTFAHYRLADAMAKTPETAMALMLAVWEPAKAQVAKDVAEMQAIIDGEQKAKSEPTFKLGKADYRYYAEKLRKAKYDLDLNEVKPYLQLEHVREAMFWAAGQLYGFQFTPVKDFSTFAPDMSVYEVTRAGKHVGYWYFDPYARAGKNSGAWMNAYRGQSRLDGKAVYTIVSNNANFIKGAPGAPVTISWDDAKTMFHEFGHALHGLNSDVEYPTLSGTRTTRDFVEFPSQINEHFLPTPGVLKFLVNEKGEPIPASLIARIEKAHTFNQGFSTVEAQESAILDMKLHLLGDADIDPKAFEKSALAELGAPEEIGLRHRIPQFGHVFSGEGYAAGYYGYLWAEVLDQDAFQAFVEAGNPYDKATAERFRRTILSVGNTVPPEVAFRNFRGRDPKVDALLRDRGFPVPTAKAAAAKAPARGE